MKNVLKEKLREEKGASLLMVIFLMLVALIVSAVIIAAAASAVSGVRTSKAQEQASLEVSSAAELVRDTYISEKMTYRMTETSYKYFASPQNDRKELTADGVGADVPFGDFTNYAISQLKSGKTVMPKTYTISLDSENAEISPVKGVFSMKYDALSSGKFSYVLTVVFENTDEKYPCSMILTMPGIIETSSTTSDNGTYKKTVEVTTVRWTDGGTLQREGITE